MPALDVSRLSKNLGGALPPEVSNEIWGDVQRESLINRVCRRVRLPGTGLIIPVITSTPEAEWVSETEEKPVKQSTFDVRTLKPYTLAVIEPFFKRFARDLSGLYNECRTRLPKSLAKKIDRTALGFEDSPGSGFDTLEGCAEVDIADNEYGGLLESLGLVVNLSDDADITAWAVSPSGEVVLLGALDNNGRPLFVLNPGTDGSVGQVLGRPTYKSSHAGENGGEVTTLGFGGDWGSATWGYVEEINVDISDQSTLTIGNKQVNLWQRNMVTIRVEVEIGFAPRDVGRFVRLVTSGPVPSVEAPASG